MNRNAILTIVGLISLFLPAAPVMSQVTPGQMPPQMPPGMGMAPGQPGASPITQPVTLTEAKLDGFFAAMEQFETLSAKADAVDASKMSDPAKFATGMKLSGEAEAILKKNGFSDTLDFQQVAYNAAMAFAVLEKGGKAAVQGELDKAKSQQAAALEKMRGQMSAEQLKMLEGQMNAGMAAAGGMYDVPEGNVELMKKYSDRMKKLNEK